MPDSSRMKLRKQLFGVRMSIRYHRLRQRFFERWSTNFKLLSIISATAVFGSIVASLDAVYSLWASGIVALAQALDLATEPGKRASAHALFSQEFIFLEEQIDGALHRRDDNEEVAARLTSERLKIEAKEPPALLWLSIKSRNEQIVSQKGPDAREIVHIPFLQRILIQFVDLWPYGRNGAAV